MVKVLTNGSFSKFREALGVVSSTAKGACLV